MHMADALLSPSVAGIMYVCSGVVGAYCIKKIQTQDDPKKIAMMGIMGAFVFATQMINFSIPATGSSGHLSGGVLLMAILGPYAAFLTMISVLFIQSLLFADGGLLALGANIWNMGFYGCFIGALIWKAIIARGISRGKIILASILASVITLQFGAFSVVLETLASSITSLPFTAFLAAMQPIHLAIGFVDGLITAMVLCFIYEMRANILWGVEDSTPNRQKFAFSKLFALLAIITFVIAGLLSLIASGLPDGLEWSLERVAGSSELKAEGNIYESALALQESIALLPDYGFLGSESILGTSFSGIVGSLVVLFLCVLGCYFFRIFKNKRYG
ncbi:energy-coupling factor ABC transporter permease [Helicobacter mesocricetorum]|uniref:energy-coupling factor ABC transporter permease n=1 Tax=Helicobacter mesocricetorum TaxID=87012 RepID=UPI000CF0F105|nr:energy-coupling factor ABC transporter permease [Helicobacter mesocricetorum]